MKKIATLVVTMTVAMTGLVGVTTDPTSLPPWVCRIMPILCNKNV